MRAEADKWRAGIRSGEVMCRCRSHGLPLDEYGHLLPSSGHRCIWDYAVHRVYELERALEAESNQLSSEDK